MDAPLAASFPGDEVMFFPQEKSVYMCTTSHMSLDVCACVCVLKFRLNLRVVSKLTHLEQL